MRDAREILGPETVAAARRFRAIAGAGYLALVLIFLVARLPSIIFITMTQTITPAILEQVTSGEWSFQTLTVLLALPFLGGVALTLYCEVWSVAAVARLALARGRDEPIPSREALAHVRLKTVGGIWLRTLPVLLLLIVIMVLGTFSGSSILEDQSFARAYWYRTIIEEHLKQAADFLYAIEVSLVILLTVLAVDEKKMEAFGGKKVRAFIVVSIVVGLISFVSSLWQGVLPVIGSRLFWLGMYVVQEMIHVLLVPLAVVAATVLHLKGGPGAEEAVEADGILG